MLKNVNELPNQIKRKKIVIKLTPNYTEQTHIILRNLLDH